MTISLQHDGRASVIEATASRVAIVLGVMGSFACSAAAGGYDGTDGGDDPSADETAGDGADGAASGTESDAREDGAIFPTDPEDARDSDAREADATPPPKAIKKVLTVRGEGQAKSYWCGPGSTRMALSTRLPDPPTQTTLASYLGTTTDGTDNIGLVAKALNHYLGTTRYVSKDIHDPPTAAQRTTLKHDIVALVDAGFPLVANVISGWRPPGYPSGTIYHYIAIVGYDDSGELVMIADPAGEGSGGSGWTKVPRTYWVSVENLGTWIGGKGFTGG